MGEESIDREEIERFLMIEIFDIFDLPLQTRNSLKVAKNVRVRTVRDLVTKYERELLRVNNLGKKRVSEIKDYLSSAGLRLGMTEAEIERFISSPGKPD